MKSISILCLVLTLFCSAQEAQILTPVQGFQTKAQSTDNEKKIIISGADTQTRSRLLFLSQDIRKGFCKLINLPTSSQRLPIHIRLYGAEGDQAPARLFNKSLSLVGNEIQIGLDLHLAKGLIEQEISRHLTELFMLELSLREIQLNENETTEFPDWLKAGVLEAARWQQDRADRQLYARVFQSKALYTVDELLEQQDSGSMLDYNFQVCSGAMVMALLNQPDGSRHLAAMIQEAAQFQGEPNQLLTKHFPQTTFSKNSLSKWWALQLATMSQRPVNELLSITETEQRLSQLLKLQYLDNEGTLMTLAPDQYHTLKELPLIQQKEVVKSTYNQLAIFLTEAFPSYRPIIAGYQEVLLALTRTPPKKRFWSFFSRSEQEQLDTAVMLVNLADERAIFDKLGTRVTDYLNWYQLEQPESQAHHFEDFIKAKQQLDTAVPSDGGPISNYLDDIQKLYE